ncbi:MAG TPA: hypothetical protein VN639_04125 [Azonexus sp.]|nr:hypothetical protein [Azonexus sp.]
MALQVHVANGNTGTLSASKHCPESSVTAWQGILFSETAMRLPHIAPALGLRVGLGFSAGSCGFRFVKNHAAPTAVRQMTNQNILSPPFAIFGHAGTAIFGLDDKPIA